MPPPRESTIALLRAVNVAAHNSVGMADLRALLEAIGLRNARTLLQSGNLIFDGGRRSSGALERLLEEETATRLGVQTEFFVRSAAQWHAIVRANPFPKEASQDPARLVVILLKTAPEAGRVTSLRAAIKGRERAELRGSEAYIVYPDGQGRSKLTMAAIEKALGTRGTARNWNTVLKLAAACVERA